MITGSGGGTGQILAGVALVAFAIVTAGAGTGFLGLGAGLTGTVSATTGSLVSGSFVLGAAASTAIGSIGTALILGGVSQMLSPQSTLATGVDGPITNENLGGPQSVERATSGIQSCIAERLTPLAKVQIFLLLMGRF